MAPGHCSVCDSPAGERVRRLLLPGTLRKYPATAFLLGINFAAFLGMMVTTGSVVQFSALSLLRWGGNFGPATIGGEYWRLITASFIHAGILHIGINMWCLYALGPVCERVFGGLQTVAIYLLTGTVGFLSGLAHDPRMLAVGASGAIFGIAGTIVAGAKFGELSLSSAQKKTLIYVLIIFVVISFAGGGFSPGIDNMAPIGGFVSGLMIGFPLGSFARKHKLYQAGIFAASCVIVLIAGHQVIRSHRGEGLLYLANTAATLKDYGEAIQLLEQYRSIQPDDVEALISLGDLYSKTKQRDKAIHAYQHALE
ncbi:MAG: rhomboid family intramembrane serine protease, partial [Actinomycetota bacterium]